VIKLAGQIFLWAMMLPIDRGLNICTALRAISNLPKEIMGHLIHSK